jgi:ABC-type transporter Mla MlaB component
MMRITVLDAETEQRLMVEGELAEPWVAELESAWERARQDAGRRPILIDVSGVTRIDRKGEAALVAIVAEGAWLTAKGVYWEYVLKQLMNKARGVRGRRFGRGGARARDLNPDDKVK